jgi:hypothetical protein
MDYHSVQVRSADLEQLAREAAGDQAAASETQAQAAVPGEGALVPDAHEADTKRQADLQNAGKLVRAVASELRRQYPAGRPAIKIDELHRRVRKAAGEMLGVFSQTTLKRAIRLTWRPGRTRPDRAKPDQPLR